MHITLCIRKKIISYPTISVEYDATKTSDTLFLSDISKEVFLNGRSLKNDKRDSILFTKFYSLPNLKFGYDKESRSILYLPLNDSVNENILYYVIKTANDTVSPEKWLYFQLKRKDISKGDTITNRVAQTSYVTKTDIYNMIELFDNKLSVVYYIFCGVTIVLLLIIIILLLYSKNNANSIKKVKGRLDYLSERRDNINKNEVTQSPSAKILSQQQIKSLITEEINKAINSQEKRLESYIQSLNNQKPSIQAQTTTPAELPFDTDQVQCDWGKNYFTLQPAEKPIFRLYRQGNTYYYTLVEGIKPYFQSMLIGTDNYITINSKPAGVARGVEVVKDGIVIPDNGIYRVDANNKLIINVI